MTEIVGATARNSSPLDGLPMLIPVPQVAEILGISRSAAYRFVACGDLPATHLGGRVYVVTAKTSGPVGVGVNGSLRQRDNGLWEYRFDAGQNPMTGRRQIRSKSGFLTKKEASAALRKAITANEGGRSVRSSSRSVGDFLTEWLASVRASLRPTSWVNYRDYARAYVVPYIGATRLQDLTPMRLNLLYSHLLEHGRVKGHGGLAPKTIQNVHRMLHRALSHAVRWDLIPRNVAEDAHPPRVKRHRPKIWSAQQLRHFITSVRDDRYYALWLLVSTTGFRRGELAGLLRGDVDLDRWRVTPSTPRVVVAGHAEESEPKTAAGIRSLALDPDTWQAMADYIAVWEDERRLLGQNIELLFVRPDGRPLHPDSLTAMFHRRCAEAGLPRIRLHDVRHSYATAALQAGVPAKVVSERLGHASVAFTLQTYTHVIGGMDQEGAKLAAAYILGSDHEEASEDDAVRILVRNEGEGTGKSSWPGTKSQASGGSGGKI